MTRPRVAIVGGGISGLAAAYQLTRDGVDWVLFEAGDRLGGIVETVHAEGFVIEGGPDSWVTEKPWAREMAVELGLADQIIPSNDYRRRTYVQRSAGRSTELVPVPDGMRMMVPARWGPLLESPLFSWQARLAYLREPKRAAELKAAAPAADESVASFVQRHFGEEVTATIAGPLLSAVFGGDIARLSVRAVMPAFVRMEAEHGSLIQALQQAAPQQPQPIFTSLRDGLQTLIDAMVGTLPASALQLRQPVVRIGQQEEGWRVATASSSEIFDAVLLATPPHITGTLLRSLGNEGAQVANLLPAEATSAIVVALAFGPAHTAKMRIPRGFGFIVPAVAADPSKHPLLACTFVDQKFNGRVPDGALLLRAFFGGASAEALQGEDDEVLVAQARSQLARALGPLPEAVVTVVRRWPRSMPQYDVGHLDRMNKLEALLPSMPGLHLAGSAYYGVGLPDLIRQGRTKAKELAAPSAQVSVGNQ